MSSSTTSGTSGEYEFTTLENQTVDKAATWTKILAIVMIIDGGLALFGCNIIGAAIKIAIGVYFLNAAKALKAVVDTEGSDVTNMMTALDKIGSAFIVRIWVMVIGVCLMLVLGMIAIAVFARLAAG